MNNVLPNLQIRKIEKWVLILFTMGTFFLAFLTLHDLQTAEGVGLYLSLQFHRDSRTGFDILVDIVGMVLLFAALFLPCILWKRLQTDSVFRMTALYLGFMPIMHPGVTVHLVDTISNLHIDNSLWNTSLAEIFLNSFADIIPLAQMELPFLLVLLAVNHATDVGIRGFLKWQRVLVLLEILLIIINILFPALSQETTYFMHYLLLIWCFYEWEKICEKNPRFSNWSLVLSGGCLLRGIYRMIELMSITQL